MKVASVTPGEIGELLAQYTWVMVGHSNEVMPPLQLVLKELVPQTHDAQLVQNVDVNGLTSLSRFRQARIEHRQLTPLQLLRLLEAGEGVVGRTGQKGWELLFPICLGSPVTLGEVKPLMTFLVVQAKNQVDGRKILLAERLPSVRHRELNNMLKEGTKLKDISLQEILFHMVFKGKRADKFGFDQRSLSQRKLRSGKKGKAN